MDDGGTPTGAALTYLAEKMLKRAEQQKVLISIGDGCPNCTSFYDKENPTSDSKQAIAKYRKKGIQIFGAILDEVKYVKSGD